MLNIVKLKGRSISNTTISVVAVVFSSHLIGPMNTGNVVSSAKEVFPSSFFKVQIIVVSNSYTNGL